MRKRPATVAAAGFLLVLAVAAAPDPTKLTARLGAPSARARDEAARELTALGAGAAPALCVAASDSDPEVRTRARALLAIVAGDGEARVRRARIAADEAMRSGGDLSAFDAALAELAPETGRCLAAAGRELAARSIVTRPLACAIARHADGPSLAALAEFVRDERILPSAAIAAARELERRLEDGGDVLRLGASEALPPLEQAMESCHAATRRAAVALYAALAPSDDVAELRTVSDGDAAVRAETARAMGVRAAARSAPRLRRLAADSSPVVRESALVALAEVPGVPHPDPAVAAASDESSAVRAACARLLARDATPETLGVLHLLAADESPRVRAAARRALAALRS